MEYGFVSRMRTIETRLDSDSELVRYLECNISVYSSIKRRMFHYMKNKDFMNQFSQSSHFLSWCLNEFQIHSRAINSLYHEIDGEMKAYMNLKKTELNQFENKLNTLEKQKEELKQEIADLRKLAGKNKLTSKQLQKYRNKKRSYYWKCNKINKIHNRISKLKYIIENNVYNICFGTKALFDKQNRLKENNYSSHYCWYEDFVKDRDKYMFFSGAKSERLGNLLFDISYDDETDSFNIRFRKLNVKKYKVARLDSNDAFVTYSGLKFKYGGKQLAEILKKHIQGEKDKQGISYRFIRRNDKWYLQLIFEDKFETANYETSDSFGVIGLDYNNGFIQSAETDCFGNLVNLQRFDLKFHGTGNKANTEIKQVLNKIVKIAKKLGKDIVIEDLNFNKTKACQVKAKRKKGKNYNRMIHLFDYSRYKQKLKDICFNNKVNLHFVNPKNTSKIGGQKFAKRMKLSIHQSASFVIARRYQGFKDNYKKQQKIA